MNVQEQLVRFVSGCGDGGVDESELFELFDSASSARLQVYRQSFRGRVVTVLQETLLAPATQLFGASLVQETLALYFAAQAPTAPDLSAALQGLPQFLSESFTGEIKDLYGLIVAASLARWLLLTGPDPGPARRGGYLKPSCLIAGKGGVRLHAAWLTATASEGSLSVDCCDFYKQPVAAADLLLVKTSATNLLAVEVPANLHGLVRGLVQGLSLTEAVQALTPAAVEALASADLAAFITALVDQAAACL